VKWQSVVHRCPRHRPHDNIGLRQGVGDGAVAPREVAKRELLCQEVVARGRLEEAVRPAVSAQQPQHDGGRHHDVGGTLDGMARSRLQQGLLLMTGGYSYVSNVGVAHRAAIAGDKGARAAVKQVQEHTGREMAPCPARRALTSPPREGRAAFNAKAAGAVAGAAGARDSWGPSLQS